MITATLATIPGREQELCLTVRSLLPQCDRVNVVCNYGTVSLPSGLLRMMEEADGKLRVSVSDNTWGDAAKFAHPADGYQLFCDDDLIYPDGYAQTMVAAIERYGRKAAVSMAGSIISGPIASYYQGRYPVGHCLAPLPHDVPCNVLGTGVLGFHSDLLTVALDEETFPTSNMADVNLAVLCQRRRIPCVCIAHAPLHYQMTMVGKPTIWDTKAEHDHVQAARCNEVKEWRIYGRAN